jgi:creatinine amidohydrolase
MENRGFAYEAAFQASERYPTARIVVMEEPFDSLTDGSMQSLFPNGFPGWPLEHAGVLETSLMLYLRGSVVGRGAPPGDRIEARPYEVLPQPPVSEGQTGVLWESAGAEAEKGRLAYEEIVAKLTAVLVREFGGVS